MPTASVVMSRLRQPASAAIAGIIFAVILIAVMVLLRDAAALDLRTGSRWASDASRRSAVSMALELIPFAGIAFLWFIGVIRSQVGAAEDRFVGTVSLGSGVLFVAMLFVAAASLKASLAATAGTSAAVEIDTAFPAALLGLFGARMAAVFVAAVTTVGRRAGALPPWLTGIGYVVAAMLLFTPPLPPLSQFLFPAWVLLLSGYLLTGRHQRPRVVGTAGT
ncbi:MAG: hypothetical protein QG597_807 [Actinomycetota bacterium]|nr:hypothetical protein [Actinomycetota bacterium]